MRVSPDKFRDAVKFLMRLGTNPTLTNRDQKQLHQFFRGPFKKKGFTEAQAVALLRQDLGWEAK